MSDIFEEVDEAVAQDKFASIWRSARWFVYSAIALVILAVGGWEVYNWQSGQSQQKHADAFYEAQQAFEARDYVAAVALFKNIRDSDSPFAGLAGHYMAYTQFMGLGDRAQAAEALADTGTGDSAIEQAALIKSAYLQADTLDFAALETLLQPVLSDTTSPFYYLADELLAAKAYQNGDLEDAKRRFSRISVSLDASEATQNRAREAVAVLEAISQTQGSAQ